MNIFFSLVDIQGNS